MGGILSATRVQESVGMIQTAYLKFLLLLFSLLTSKATACTIPFSEEVSLDSRAKIPCGLKQKSDNLCISTYDSLFLHLETLSLYLIRGLWLTSVVYTSDPMQCSVYEVSFWLGSECEQRPQQPPCSGILTPTWWLKPVEYLDGVNLKTVYTDEYKCFDNEGCVESASLTLPQRFVC